MLNFLTKYRLLFMVAVCVLCAGFVSKTYHMSTISQYTSSSDLVQEMKSGHVDALSSFLTGAGNSFQSNIVQENRYLLILEGLKTTVVISVLSTFLGTFLGAIVCFMRMSSNSILSMLAGIYI